MHRAAICDRVTLNNATANLESFGDRGMDDENGKEREIRHSRGSSSFSARSISGLPLLSSLSSNNVASLQGNNNGWTRKSKSSVQSDESFSAYLHHFPSSSSPALDRISDARLSASRATAQQQQQQYYQANANPTSVAGEALHPQHHRRLPSLDAIGYAQERAASGYPLPMRTPQRLSLRDVCSMHDSDRSVTRQSRARDFSTPWRDSEESRQRQHDLQHAYPSSIFDSNTKRDNQHYSPDADTDKLNSEPDVCEEDQERATVSGQDANRNAQDDQDEEGEGDEDEGLENNDENEEDAEKKRRRRRTNKIEAKVLAAVFEHSAFPDMSTREALAARLNMTFRSVSTWFQNRRQAMKKRASRFGGINGVQGATVTGAVSVSPTSYTVAKPLSTVTSKISPLRAPKLEEVAARASEQFEEDETTSVLHDHIAQQVDALTDPPIRTCAPILDMLRKRAGDQRLLRITSMPCIAAALEAKRPAAIEVRSFTKPSSAKDLRHILDEIVVAATRQVDHVKSNTLVRSASMAALPSLQAQAVNAFDALPKRSIGADVSMKDETLSKPEPLDVVSQAPISFSVQEREIWKRMQSSSSGLSSSTNTPESDKENKRPKPSTAAEDALEDEENTLRRIAQKRQAKREQKLSAEGLKYVQEADARLALQRKHGKDDSSCLPLISSKKLAPIARRALSRSVSDVGRTAFTRVTSLDFEAGRDRAVQAPPRVALSAQSMAERLGLHSEKSRKSVSGRSSSIGTKQRSSSSSALRLRHSLGGVMPREASRAPLAPLDQTQVNASVRRRAFAPTNSMPAMPRAASYSNGASLTPSSSFTHARKDTVLRESNSRRANSRASDGSTSSSQGSSEEWTDSWARDRVAPDDKLDQDRHDLANIRKRKSTFVQGEATSDRYAPIVPLHDDSGFFGSDEASCEEEQDENTSTINVSKQAAAKKRRALGHHDGSRRTPLKSIGSPNAALPSERHATSLPSSSPLKRGDERDRLAAETLLAFGSYA